MSAPAVQPGWRARLELGFERRGPRTVLAHRRHQGPLVVQRPFYPEGGTCHVYLVHPPGGIVGGDLLELDAHVGTGAQSLITTPAATKFYRSAGARARLRQTLQVRAGAALEWLPQETIVFDGACAETSTRVELEGDARFFGWEVVCLGRPASGDDYRTGEMCQCFELWRHGAPAFVERATLDGGSRVLAEAWGLAGCTVSATLIATGAQQAQRDQAREALDAVGNGGPEGRSVVTLIDDVLVCRHLGFSAEFAHRQLASVWAALRPSLLARRAVPPRIWST